MQLETEIKLKAADPETARRLLEEHGFTIHKPRIFERNLIYDSPDSSLRRSGRVLRLRLAGDAAILTFKGPAETGRHKSREEREVRIESFAEMQAILERLGYQAVFVYEKYRTEYQRPHSPGMAPPGIATIDETPAGTFMELEGEAAWIDATAAALGFTPRDYITESYAKIYVRAAASAGSAPVETAPSSPPAL